MRAFIAPALLLGALLLAGLWHSAADGTVPVHVRVTDAGTGEPLPCRLTILDRNGELVPIQAPPEPWLAVRTGVVYTGTGEARFSLPRARYTLHATRGPEYGLATRALEVIGKPVSIDLKLTRELDTPDYVSCDTHIHTLTYSGHGDSTLRERMATIAGEGIEVAVATDHNHHTDYAPVARATGTAPTSPRSSGTR